MVPGLAVAGAAVALLWSQAGAQPPAPLRQTCTRAAMVDGRLRCDDELPIEVAGLCPGPGPEASEPIAAGDAFESALLCARSFAAPGQPGWTRMSAEDLTALQQPIDLNRAAVDELVSLPRIGPKLARRIVEGRPYEDLEALVRVRGIGPATVQRLRGRAFARPTHAATPWSATPSDTPATARSAGMRASSDP